MGYLRVGGHFVADDGATVTWNAAEGVRGRRWRWIRVDRAGESASALLETAPDGRPRRLEVAAAAGLLVLHPEPDEREAHGNVVGPGGVRPLAFAWSPDHVFDVADLPWVALACVADRPAAELPAAGSVARPTLLVARDLRVTAATRVIVPMPDGLPTVGERWPLE